MTDQQTASRELVCAVHPTSFGFGWVVFEGPNAPVDWGLVSARAKRQHKLFARFDRILNRYEPSVLVTEAFAPESAERSLRIQRLYRELIHRAQLRGMRTPIYGREVVRSCFTRERAIDRYDIAQAVANRIAAFAHRMPRARKAWHSEDARQSLFDAAALALTYYALKGED